MKLWIDDERPAPDETWTVAKTSAEALVQLEKARLLGQELVEVSFDHDLGGADDTRRVMNWIIEQAFWPATVYVHTANPVGRKWLVGTARSYAPDGVTVRDDTTPRPHATSAALRPVASPAV